LLNDVIILAKGEGRVHCPFDAEEVWVVNDAGLDPCFKDRKVKIDKVFRFDDTDLQFLADMRQQGPIISWREYADIKYPIEEIKKEFKTNYFSNTISYMIAYAIYTGVKQLRFFGVDAPYGGIYETERSGIEYWLGRAEDRGVKCIPGPSSHLLLTMSGNLYGETREGKVPLYFGERLVLLNLLPLKGTYREMDKCALARWFLTPKQRECKLHNVKLTKLANGQYGYECPQEFAERIWMTEEAWSFVAEHLRKLDKEGTLPVDAATVYKKMVLLPEGGER